MPEFMRSPAAALIWQIWARNRTAIWWVIGITTFASLISLFLPDRFFDNGSPSTFDAADAVRMLGGHLIAAVILLVLSIFSYTEYNAQRGTPGFPDRLFVLPVTSFRLVAVPMISGVAAALLLYTTWSQFILHARETGWLPAIVIATYITLYQMILWTLPGPRAARMLLLGMIAITFIMFPALAALSGVPQRSVSGVLAGLAFAAFLTSWAYIARQRSGGGTRQPSPANLGERLSAWMPRGDRAFRSPMAAQFWFEWRRSGLVLPLLVGGLLVIFIGPFSWYFQTDPSLTLRVLATTLAMPMVLALMVAKAFSKPDFWSMDLSFPSFLAVRPLNTVEMVWIKMKVAATSVAISWLLVFIFLSIWLPLWANTQSLIPVFSAFKSHYAISILSVFAVMLLTWRFLIGNMWLGLLGNKTLFIGTAVLYAILTPLGFVFLMVRSELDKQSEFDWLRNNLDRVIPALLWIAAIAVISKYSLSLFFWRKISGQRARQYLSFWAAATLCLLILAFLLRNDAGHFRTLLILSAFLVVPLARIGLAPTTLAKNRHR